MSSIFNDTMQGLLEAIAIEKGTIQTREVDNMSAPTFRAETIENKQQNKGQIQNIFHK